MMNDDAVKAARALKRGAMIHGFRVDRVRPAPGMPGTAVEARHLHSGARLLYIAMDDPEKLLSIAVRTPPPDDTGVPHILEHSVLGGSRKYPVKDPFVELLKTSLATFINAMTYPDRTVYPIASTVKKDFFNLADVYIDAVFHPNITPMTLKQEGHHLDFAEPGNIDSPLIIKGIVYNEMRGAYSNPDSVVGRASTRGLFPDSPYGRDSGGDPEAIPRLTYEKFRRFYQRFYHPSNAFLFAYGDLMPGELLRFLDERLRELPPARRVLVRIPYQSRWSAPREITASFPIAPHESPKNRSAVTLNWIVGAVEEPRISMALDIIDHLLLGTAAAPLRKALIDSRLGEDLIASGYSAWVKETTFHVGLKGTEPERKPEIVGLVEEVLRQTSESAFPREAVESAFHQLEYSHREVASGFPLSLMNAVYNGWLYGLDPLTYIREAEFLEQLRREYHGDPRLFNRLIGERLVENPHRLTVVATPDPQLSVRREKKWARRLAARKRRMTREQLEDIRREAEELERRQSTPNSPEALATLPQLHLRDIPKVPRAIPTDVVRLDNDVTALRNNVFANGVNYLMAAFDLRGLPRDLWPYLPIFTTVFNQISGTRRHSYLELAERRAAVAGSLSVSLGTVPDARDPGRNLATLTLRLKALDRKFEDALELASELLFEFDLGNRERLRDILVQNRARTRAAIVPAGHRLAARHAARNISPILAVSELLNGLPAIRLGERLAANFDREHDELCERLVAIHKFVLARAPLLASFTGSNGPWEAASRWVADLGRGRSRPESGLDVPDFTSPRSSGIEGLAIESDVAFCARVLPAPHASAPDSIPLFVFSQLLAFNYLWEEVREKGGAYGGMCSYDSSSSTFTFLSYRDPWIQRTFEVFRNVGTYLERTRWPRREVERAVIGCLKGDEQPIRPDAATGLALGRFLANVDEEWRRERRERLLRLGPDEIRDRGIAFLRRSNDRAAECVIAARNKLEQANQEMGGRLEIEDIIPES